MSVDSWIAREQHCCAHNYQPIPVVLTEGKGVWLKDVEGKTYLDMMSAYSAVSHGHGHPALLEVLKRQAEKLCIPSRAFYHDQMAPFLEKLCQLCKMDMALPMNTGAEAVETAIKAARRWGYQVKGVPENQAEILVAENNFHGRTVTITSFSTEREYKAGFGPYTPGFKAVPFGGDIRAIEAAITDTTVAFLVEPMQGEAGIHIPPKGWLAEVSALLKQKNVLLILDEIQTGLGRTGEWFAYVHENIQPDGLILGKALGGGILPVSAFVARQSVMEVFTPGSHGSTFGGNPLACAVALKALEVMETEKLIERSKTLGAYFLDALKSMPHPAIKDVRGCGLWIGVEFDPNIIPARVICERLAKAGVLAKDVHEVVVRFAPPLIIEKDEIDVALNAYATCLD